MKNVTLLLAIVIVIICIKPSYEQHEGAKKKFDMAGFRKCIKQCYDQFTVCTNEFKQKWMDFSDKKVQKSIIAKLKSCCLDGEHDHDAGPEVSFATCSQRRCEAELWGCKIRKAHKETQTIHEA